MSMKEKKRRNKNKILSYPESAINSALAEIGNGSSIHSTSIKYGIPYSTLFYKHSGKNPIERKMGPSTYLSLDEENCLVEWIQTSASRGFPVTKEHLLDSVQILIRKLKRETPFKNNRPGRHWYESFLKRHPQLSLRTPQNLTSSRASVTEKSIRQWFHEIRVYFSDNNYLHVIENPRRVFNSDESAFFLNPKESKVIVRKGEKTVYNFIANDEKECLTTLITGNAAGELAPPMVMFVYERIPANVANRIPDTWGIGRSESGWMTGETFYEYISNVFLPWVKGNQIELPIVLYVDGHRSHLTFALSNFCSENGIILIALYPNSTHIIQPMDVAVFHPLKTGWRAEVRTWKIENEGKKITKEYFCPILERALKKSVKRETLINGFRSCGLYPLNANAVNYGKYFNSNVEPSTANIRTEAEPDSIVPVKHCREFLLYLENAIGTDKTRSFCNSDDLWQGAIEDTSLFNFWKNLKRDVDLNKTNATNNDQDENSTILPNATVTSAGDLILDCEWIEEIIRKPLEGSESPGVNNQIQEVEPSKRINILSDVIIHHEDFVEVNGRPSKEYDNYNEERSILSENSVNIDNKFNENETEIKCMNVGFEKENHPGMEAEDKVQADDNIECLNKTKEKAMINEVKQKDEVQKSGTEDCEITVIHETPKKCIANVPPHIPSPFKSALFWPEASKSTKPKRSKEKIPTVVTSIKWKEYHQKKDEEKKIKEQKLNDRKRKRAEKATEKAIQQEKKMNLNRNNEKSEMGSVTKNNYVKDCFVIVKYEDKYYPGQILNLTETQLRVNVMTRSGPHDWKWPHTPDVLWYDKEDVIEVIAEPKLINNRGIYKVEEMRDYKGFENE